MSATGSLADGLLLARPWLGKAVKNGVESSRSSMGNLHRKVGMPSPFEHALSLGSALVFAGARREPVNHGIDCFCQIRTHLISRLQAVKYSLSHQRVDERCE